MLDFIKIKNVCSEKNSFKRMKRQNKDWENRFKNLTKNLQGDYIFKKALTTNKKKKQKYIN